MTGLVEWIPEELQQQLGLREFEDADEAAALLGRKSSEGLEGPFLAIPYPDCGDFVRLRTSGKDKYLSPHGDGCRLYTGALTEEALKGRAPLHICESEKKALAAQLCGLVAVGLGGVDAGCPGGQLLPQFEGCNLQGRSVVIVFDSDRDEKFAVWRASARLGMLLQRAGAKVSVTTLPRTDDGKGDLEDFFRAKGKAAVLQVVSDARAADFVSWLYPSERGCALALADQLRTRVGFDVDGTWYALGDGELWTAERSPVGVRQHLDAMGSLYAGMVRTKEELKEASSAERARSEDAKALVKRLGQSAGQNAVLALLQELLQMDGLSTFDQRRDLLPFRDGCWDVLTGAREPHRRANRTTVALPRDMPQERSGQPSAWLGMLGSMFPNDADREAFRMMVGYTLSEHSNLKAAFVLIGPKNSGKTTALEVLARVLGPLASAVNVDVLTRDPRSGGGKPSPELVRVCQPRLRMVWAEEGDARKGLDESLFKQLTNGSETQGIVTRQLYSNAVRFCPFPAVLWLGTNALPSFAGGDAAATERLWPLQVEPPGKLDRGLPARLSGEREAITQWCLDAAQDYSERHGVAGMPKPQRVVENAQDLADDHDVFALAADACWELDAGSRVPAVVLLEVFNRWCVAHRKPGLRKSEFWKRFKEVFGPQVGPQNQGSEVWRDIDGGDGRRARCVRGIKVYSAELERCGYRQRMGNVYS